MKGNELRPAKVFPPGSSIRNELEARGWSQKQFAQLLGRPAQYVSELLNGKRQITIEAARELEAALGPSAQFWLGLESHYRLWLAAKNDDSQRLRDIRDRVSGLDEARAS
ncbi:MAG: HTH-type transcriptional regulator / antitoxin HigA [Fimbriimonadaceae bacterium]|jgi:HTH-type transcriptional regulator/antitoxin HigA|nr:HTH-type transcriptional regulator / antitoxin HigA [Fimbriimonadaceae bacterium]